MEADPDAALRDRAEPVLIDEWQLVPSVLGAVKRAVDAVLRDGNLFGRLLDTFVFAQLRGELQVGFPRPRLYHLRRVAVRSLPGLIDRRDAIQPAFDVLLAVVDETLPIDAEDVEAASASCWVDTNSPPGMPCTWP